MSADFLKEPRSLKGKKIWVAGHNGLVGGAMLRALQKEGAHILTTSRAETDLRSQRSVELWMRENLPDIVILAAATVGGIRANNDYPADFIYDNLMIETNVMQAAAMNGVEHLLFLGSACIYPKNARQPMAENLVMTGPLEPTNEAYAMAKIAGIKMGEAYRKQYKMGFIAAMPCNVYGVGDRYDAERSHVIPALIMKMHEAAMDRQPVIELWGTGRAKREFIEAEDLGRALLHLLKYYNGRDIINVGTGEEISIQDLAYMIKDVVGYEGEIKFDHVHPDGAARRVLDSGRLYVSGWRPQTLLKQGLKRAYQDYLAKRERLNNVRHA